MKTWYGGRCEDLKFKSRVMLMEAGSNVLHSNQAFFSATPRNQITKDDRRLMHGSTWPVTSLSYPVCSAAQRSFTSLKGFLFHMREIPSKCNWSQWTTSLVLTGESDRLLLLLQRFPVMWSHPALCINYMKIIFRKISKYRIVHVVTNHRDLKPRKAEDRWN